MADSLKDVSPKVTERPVKVTNIIQRTTSETLRINDHDFNVNATTVCSPGQNAAQPSRKKTSSFQITSVINRSDYGDDSTDDMDTEDSSEVVELSRVTDTETPSYSEDTCSREDNVATTVVTHPMSTTVMSTFAKVTDTPKTVQTRSGRFKVVKIESTEPFRRGRWWCMDYLDHPMNVTSGFHPRFYLPTVGVNRHQHGPSVRVATPFIVPTMPSLNVGYPTQRQPTMSVATTYPQPYNRQPFDSQQVNSAAHLQQQQQQQQQTQSYASLPTQVPTLIPTQGQTYTYTAPGQYQNRPAFYQGQNPQQQFVQPKTEYLPSSVSAGPTMTYPQYVAQQQQQQLITEPYAMPGPSAAPTVKTDGTTAAATTPFAASTPLIESKDQLATTSAAAIVGNTGVSSVAIDNKIELAMDLVKSHLMFAVREEVEVLKSRIAELTVRINQLEIENSFLKANANQETLDQLVAVPHMPRI